MHTHSNLYSLSLSGGVIQYSHLPFTVVEITIQTTKSEEEEPGSHSTFKITAIVAWLFQEYEVISRMFRGPDL